MGDASLTGEYWLLTTGVQEESQPRAAVRCGIALAAIRELELAGEVRWVGRGEGCGLDPVADCRCREPLRAWHDALQEHAVPGEPVAARFVLDPLLPLVWGDVADSLVGSGDATLTKRRLGADRYRVTDRGWVRGRRAALLQALGSEASPHDLRPRDLDLFAIAWATNSLSALLRTQDVDPPDAVLRAVDVATAGSPLRARGEEVMAFRGPGLVGPWGPAPL